MRIVTAIAVLLCAAAANAACIQPPEEGTWIDGESRIVLRFVCQDMVINGQLYPPGPPWYLNELPARQLASTGQIYAVSADTRIYAKMSAYRAGQLWVYTLRGKSGTHQWFTRAGN